MVLRRALRLAAVVVFAAMVAPSSGVEAQVINFDDLAGNPNYSQIPTNYGSTANVAVTNRSRVGYGNAAVATNCTGGPNVLFWNTGYSSLVNNAFACASSAVGEFLFDPDAGMRVFLNSLQLGSWPAGSDGVGTPRAYRVDVFEVGNWTTPIFTQSGIVSATLTVNPNVSSTSGLYLQWGGTVFGDWNVGIDNINFAARPTGGQPGVVPEPATMVLLGTGLAGLAGAARRRRQKAQHDA